jgi:hypothetical protein
VGNRLTKLLMGLLTISTPGYTPRRGILAKRDKEFVGFVGPEAAVKGHNRAVPDVQGGL